MRARRRGRRGATVVGLVLVAFATAVTMAACSSGGSDAAPPGTTRRPAEATTTVTGTVPPLPAGVQDCGEIDTLVGWPTTFVATYEQPVRCLTTALATGSPARLAILTPGRAQARHRINGYPTPVRIVTTFSVLGRSRIEVVVDRTADGAGRATRMCKRLVAGGFADPPAPADCHRA
jgi:hypothetical protein